MNIEFMFNDITDIKLIYNKEEKYDCNIGEIYYLGTDYCEKIIKQLKSYFSEIKSFNYIGQTDRIAHEEYTIETISGKYTLSFTIDTFNRDKQSQILVKLYSSSDLEQYDVFLEKLKVFIKEILLKDWKMCTWIIDEQSEYLGMKLYPLIFKTENKMRGFINKVLTHTFGVKWIDLIGIESIKRNYSKNMVEFKRKVPEFNNINDTLISLTVESLNKLMLKSKIYENDFNISDTDSINLHKLLADQNHNAVFEKLMGLRKEKVDIWEDIFKKYFDNDINTCIEDFIKNRNHVAHNKLLTNASYQKMKKNILSLETMFDKANELFLNEEPSDELYETWVLEEEEMQNNYEYRLDRIENETGIKILLNKGIFDLFEENIQNIHTEIDDYEYFNYAVDISSINTLQNDLCDQIIFSVKSKVDSSFDFDVCTLLNITEGMGEDSYLHLWIEKSDKTKLLETQVIYHNGEAHEDTMEFYYIADDESYFEDEVLKSFIEDLKNYINYEMNTIKEKADKLYNLSITEGERCPVADFPCWNCNQNYISINDELYPYSYCINCGEKNEIQECLRCGVLYPSEYGDENLCSYCFDKLEKE